MIVVSVPGKLMLSGEWAVLEKGYPCLVLAINKRIKATIKESEQFIVSSLGVGVEDLVFRYEKGKLVLPENISIQRRAKLSFFIAAVEIVFEYLRESDIEIKFFEIEIESEITLKQNRKGGTQKVGLGSSASLTVAVIAAILSFHEKGSKSKNEQLLIFKLASLSHFKVQSKLGSSFDIAASVFGGLVYYERFDSDIVTLNLEKNGLQSTLETDWKGLVIENLSFPSDLKIGIGFTGKGASTTKLIEKVLVFKERNPEEYLKVINKIKDSTLSLKEAIELGDRDGMRSSIGKNHEALKSLSESSGANLLTVKLKKLVNIVKEHGCAGKFSGAGGGDIGIGVCFCEKKILKIEKEWKKEGIIPISVTLDLDGVREERSGR